MAIPNIGALEDMFKHGIGVQMLTANMMSHVELSEFFFWPEPGERNPWPDRAYFPWEPYDDGGGAAVAFYRYGACPFSRSTTYGLGYGAR